MSSLTLVGSGRFVYEMKMIDAAQVWVPRDANPDSSPVIQTLP